MPADGRGPRGCGGRRDAADPLFRHHHALVIGIGDYAQQGRLDEQLGQTIHAAEDAVALGGLLHHIGYARSQVHCLLDQEATLDTIRSRLFAWRTLERAELFLLFWGGHGIHCGGRTLLLPYDADSRQLGRTSLTVNEVVTLACDINSSNVAVFFDTCYSAPRPPRLFHPEWTTAGPSLADRVLLFAGASTLALDTGGGVLSACLREALSDRWGRLCDEEGTVYLGEVAADLQRSVDARAQAAWIAAGQPGRAPQEPFIASINGRLPAVGRNLRRHVEQRLAEEEFPWPMMELARRALTRGGPGPEVETCRSARS